MFIFDRMKIESIKSGKRMLDIYGDKKRLNINSFRRPRVYFSMGWHTLCTYTFS